MREKNIKRAINLLLSNILVFGDPDLLPFTMEILIIVITFDNHFSIDAN